VLIPELSERTGTPAATIKYYVREGLLPAGDRVGGNRTEYTDEHERRLKLIRAMLEVGKLSIAAVRTVLDALDEPDAPVVHAFDAAQQAVSRSAVPDIAPPSVPALDRVDALIARAGWADCDDNIGRAAAGRSRPRHGRHPARPRAHDRARRGRHRARGHPRSRTAPHGAGRRHE
jgi:DNA-binding transcriptional MerR regulator